MNRIKEIFDDYVVVPGTPIDPYGLASPGGPWIVGSFALWHYIKNTTGQDPEWQYDDIDYVVHTEEQGNYLLNYFRQFGRNSHVASFLFAFAFELRSIGFVEVFNDISHFHIVDFFKEVY